MPTSIPLTPIGDRDVTLDGASFSTQLRESGTRVCLTEHYEGRVTLESAAFGGPFLFIGEMYSPGALADLLEGLDKLSSSDLKQGLSVREISASIEELEKGRSTLVMARNIRQLAGAVGSEVSRRGLSKLAGLLAGHYDSDYGRQMMRYVRSGQLEEAGALSIEESPVHITSHAELARLVVGAFSGEGNEHRAESWMGALHGLQKVGYPELASALGAFTLRRLQSHIYLGYEARAGLREGDLFD